MHSTAERREENSHVILLITIIIIIVVIAPIVYVVIETLDKKEQAVKRLKAKTSCPHVLKNDGKKKPCAYTMPFK